MSYKGRINQYTCQTCGGYIITIDTDEGTSAFTVPCEVESCEGRMYSSMYRVVQDLTPTHEWYKGKIKKNMPEHIKQHIKLGGLLFRKLAKKDE